VLSTDDVRSCGGALSERSPDPPSPSARRGQGGGRRRPWAQALAAVLLLGASVAAAAGHAAADEGFVSVEPVGTLTGPGCGANEFVVDSPRGVVLDVRGTAFGCPSNTPRSITISAYATSSLRRVAGATLATPSGMVLGWLPGYSFQSPVVDPVGQRVFVPLTDLVNTYLVAVYRIGDLLSGTTQLRPVRTLTMPSAPKANTPVSPQDPTGPPTDSASGKASPTLAPCGMYYDAANGVLDVLSGTRSDQFVPVASPRGPAANDLYVEEYNATTGAFRWERSLGECSASFSGALISGAALPIQDPLMRLHSGGQTQVVVGCVSDRGPYLLGGGTVQQFPPTAGLAGGSMLTYTIPLDGRGMPTGTPVFFLGRPAALAGLADPDSGRMFYANAPVDQGTSAATSPSPTAVSFDVAHQTYVGASTVNGADVLHGGYAMGVGNGRLYGAGPSGIYVINARNTPPGQGVRFPVFGCFAQDILVDPPTHRLFVQLYGKCNENGAQGGAPDPLYQPRLAVFQDDTPDDTLTLSNPDSHTQDIAEVPGVTQTTFSGRSRATAVRLRVVGGTRSLIDSATFGIYTAITGNSLEQLPGDYATREYDFANVNNADLDNFQSSASAISAAADEATRGQLKEATTVTVTDPNGQTVVSQPGQSWPFTEASCNGSNNDDVAIAGTDSAVTCNHGKESTAHSVVGSLSVVTGQALPLGVGGGEVSTSTALTTQGMTSTVRSVVHGVVLGPIAIDSVTASVTCVAHGRHDTAKCTYDRALHGVSNAGAPLASGSCADSGSVPSADTCAQLVAAINGVLPGYLVVTLGYPDTSPGLLGGTPHGYQATAQKERYEFLQDQTLNYDNSLQVPGLEVLYVQDSQGAPSRLDLQLAGVEGESHYGITTFSAPGGAGLVDLPPLTGIVGPAPAPTGGEGLTPPPNPTGGGLGPAQATTSLSPGVLLQKIFDTVSLAWRSPGTALLASMLIGLLASPLGVARRRARLLQELEQL